MLNAYHQLSLAIDLIKRKAPIGVVHEATGLPIPSLRITYRNYHGYSSSRGASKQSTQGITRNNKMFKEATVFAVCYQTTEFKINESDINKIIIAFDAFKKIHPSSQLNFSGACVIVQDLLARKIELTRCRCESWVLLGARAHGYERCGVCRKKLKIDDLFSASHLSQFG